MDVIKRANQIWTNDSLYLRDYDLIPLPNTLCNSDSSVPTFNGVQPNQNGACSISNSNDTSASDNHFEIVTRQDLLRNSKSVPRSKSCMDSISDSCEKSSDSRQQHEPNAKDFLSKFDLNLEQIKRNIERLDANTK